MYTQIQYIYTHALYKVELQMKIEIKNEIYIFFEKIKNEIYMFLISSQSV